MIRKAFVMQVNPSTGFSVASIQPHLARAGSSAESGARRATRHLSR